MMNRDNNENIDLKNIKEIKKVFKEMKENKIYYFKHNEIMALMFLMNKYSYKKKK